MSETSPWLSPRAYIIKMDSGQMRQLSAAQHQRAQVAFNEYMTDLANRNRA